MPIAETHYEVQIYDGRSWSILGAMDDAESAKHAAKTAFATGKHRGVKVTRERYDPDSGMFATLTIVSHGQTAKPKRIAERQDPLDKISICWNPADLYSYEGRRAIRMVMASTLDNMGITPTELLHDPQHYKKLDGSGTILQNAVQRTAIKQVQGTEISVQERMRQLYEMLSKAYVDLRKLLESDKPVELRKVGLDSAIETYSEHHQRTTLLSASITNALAEEKDIWSKFTYCLTHLKPGLPSWVVGILDYLFAEMMQTPAILRAIMQANQNDTEVKRIIGLVKLRYGEAAIDGFEVFNDFILANNLPQTQTALQQLLVKQMRGPTDLIDGDLKEHLDAIGQIKSACKADIKREDNYSDELMSAIAGRCERALSPHRINAYMADTTGPLQRAERLMVLEPKIFGKPALKQLSEQVLPIVVPTEQHVAVLKSGDNPMHMMAQLRRIQVLGRASRLDEQSRERLDEALDIICRKIMEKTDIVAKVMATETEEWEKALQFLNLLANATFTEGACASQVRGEARQLMRTSGLLDEVMKNADTAEKQVLELKKLMDLLTAAGMGEGKALKMAS